MAATGRIKMTFSISRKGESRAWSTSFHLDPAVPDLTTFEDLADWLAEGFRESLYSDVEITGASYYPPGADIPTHSKPFSITGGRAHSDDTQLSSDTVALWRWPTTARTSKNHPIYLFNYVHGARGRTGTAGDLLNT